MSRRPLESDRFALLLAGLVAVALAACGGSGGGSSGGGGGSTFDPGPFPVAGTTSHGGCTDTFSGSDPMTIYQWYLDNAGGTNAPAFASGGAVLNQDINFNSTTETGCGVKVAIVDQGMEIAHEDLADNVVDGASVRFNVSPFGSDPTNTSTKGDHGTSVAGLIAMRGGNGIGGRGVASEASIVGYNFLKGSQSDANEVIALGGADYTNDTDVFNQSYGLGVNFTLTIGEVNLS